MRFSSLFTRSAAVLAFASTLVAAADGESDVLDLKAANFESSVNGESLILVEFFAPWCGHCKALAPHYEEAATALKEKNIKLAKVDCVEEADLCQSHGVQGYPTLKVFRNGSPSEYNGPRKADGIISYMVKQSLPAVSEVTAANVEEIKKADKLVVVAYLSTSTSAPAPEFSAAAEKLRDEFLFGISTDADLITAEGVQTPSIVVYRSFDDPKTEYPYPVAGATEKDIQEWIKELSIPILDEVNGENYATYAGSGKPLAYLFLDPSDAKQESYLKAFHPIAAKYHSQLNFVWIDAVKFGDHAKALNLVEPKWPSFVIQDLTQQLKFPLSQKLDYSPEEVLKFVEQYTVGDLEPELKSQPIPESQDESVTVIVGKEFEKYALDEDKDVFLELYASWCGHCKRLKPTWDSLGDRYADIKDRITIAKFEAAENDLPPSAPFRVSGFPTIKFKPAGKDSQWLDYEGDRSIESLIAFVEEHAVNPLDPAVAWGNESTQATFAEPEPEPEAVPVAAEHNEL